MSSSGDHAREEPVTSADISCTLHVKTVVERVLEVTLDPALVPDKVEVNGQVFVKEEER